MEISTVALFSQFLLSNGRIDECLDFLADALQKKPEPEFLIERGKAYLCKGDIDNCIASMRAGMETHFNEGHDWTRYHPSLAALRQVLEAVPTSQPALDCLRAMAKQFKDDPQGIRGIQRTARFMEEQQRRSPEEQQAAHQSLHLLGLKYGTDKSNGLDGHTEGGFSYMDIYEPYLRPLKDRPINFLEIGVLNGSSVQTWQAYFTQGRIFGLDINPHCMQFQTDRIKITIGSQADPEVLARVRSQVDAYDVVLDDGSHYDEHMRVSFQHLWPAVRPGGMYIIEDLGCTYGQPHRDWPGMAYNKDEPRNSREDFERFLTSLVRDLDAGQQDLLAVHMWHYIAIILKRPKFSLIE